MREVVEKMHLGAAGEHYLVGLPRSLFLSCKLVRSSPVLMQVVQFVSHTELIANLDAVEFFVSHYDGNKLGSFGDNRRSLIAPSKFFDAVNEDHVPLDEREELKSRIAALPPGYLIDMES